MTQVRRILVPLDHSPGLEAILEYACIVARGVGASVTLLHVYVPPGAMVGIVPGATPERELIADHAAAARLLDRAAEIARSHGLPVVDRIIERASPTSRAIVDQAQQGKFDLIVMGTHARGRLARLVMGSTAENVLLGAPCPVLMVHLPHG